MLWREALGVRRGGSRLRQGLAFLAARASEHSPEMPLRLSCAVDSCNALLAEIMRRINTEL